MKHNQIKCNKTFFSSWRFLGLGNLAWVFLVVNFWFRKSCRVLILSPFNQPCHLKSEYPPGTAGQLTTMSHFYISLSPPSATKKKEKGWNMNTQFLAGTLCKGFIIHHPWEYVDNKKKGKKKREIKMELCTGFDCLTLQHILKLFFSDCLIINMFIWFCCLGFQRSIFYDCIQNIISLCGPQVERLQLIIVSVIINYFNLILNCMFRSKGLKDEHGNEVHKFDHPWFQTGLMFIGKNGLDRVRTSDLCSCSKKCKLFHIKSHVQVSKFPPSVFLRTQETRLM